MGKMEGKNSTCAIKDRPALSMIKHAQMRCQTKPCDTLIEATSGSTGIALAMRGHKIVLLMPKI